MGRDVPAQVGAMLGMPARNLAVHGYSTDQVYLRLEPSFPVPQPVAVVSLFMTALFGRNLDDDRPHLGRASCGSPRCAPAAAALARLIVPYRRDATVERGVHVTREVLARDSRSRARRGATPLIVVPQFGPGRRAEEALRRRILEAGCRTSCAG